MINTNDPEDYQRIIVAVKELGTNSKEIVYKHLRKNLNHKIKRLQEIKERLDNDKFEMPMIKRKRENNTTISEPENKLEKQLVPDATINSSESSENITSEDNKFRELTTKKNVIQIEKEIFSEFYETDNEEYDPNNPNDYQKEIKLKQQEEKIRKKMIKKQADALEKSAKKKQSQKSSSLIDKLIQEKEEINDKNFRPMIISENVAINSTESNIISKTSRLKSQDKAKKMLEKMGWGGLGLGKYEQGIVTPLVVKKTGEKYGIIINANTKKNPPEPKVNAKNFYNRSPTKILLINNIINKNEINEEIYHEIREECENYGNVIDVKFFQFNFDDLPSGEAVRVFVEYDSVDSAIRAFTKLYDRYFSERVIRVKFYDEDLYYNNFLDSFNY